MESPIVELHTAGAVADGPANDGSRETHVSALEIALSCAAAVVLCLLIEARAQPARVSNADAAPTEFSALRAERVLRDLLAAGVPHPAGSAEQAIVRERIVNSLRESGYQPEIQETLARGPSGRIAVVRNVLARARGTEGGRAILLCAHYDSIGAGPGAADDGAGVAAVLEIARACSALPSGRHDAIFLLSDAEEIGMAGASAFAEQHPWMADVAAAVNLEARGSSGPCMLFEASRDNAWLVHSIARAVPRPWVTSAAETIFKNMPDDTDLAVFRARGVPGLNFAFLGQGWNNHTGLDDLAHLDRASLQQLGDAALALLGELRDGDGQSRAHGELVYADVLNTGIVYWPRSVTWLIALATCMVVAAATWVGIRRGSVTWRSLAIASAMCALTLAACTLLGTAPIAAVNAARHVRDAGLLQPNALRVALVSAVLVGLLGCAMLSRRLGIGFAPLWLGASLVCCGAGLVSAVARPDVSYLFVLPSVGAALACVLARVDSGFARTRQIRLATWMLCTSAAVFWFPVFVAMELGFDYELGYVLAAPLAVIALTLLPVCARGSARALRGLLLSAGVVCAAASATALAVPTSSPERPGWINLRYIANATGREARWEASTFGAELPAPLAAAAPFERAQAPPFPWLTLDPSLFTAPAPIDRFDPPVWESIDAVDTPDGRVFRGRLRSARGASRLHLHLPPEIRLRSVTWTQHVVRGGFENTSTQLLFGLTDQGVEVELWLSDRRAASFWLLDQDWTLPPEAAALRAARPPGFVPRSDGDVSIVGREVILQ